MNKTTSAVVIEMSQSTELKNYDYSDIEDVHDKDQPPKAKYYVKPIFEKYRDLISIQDKLEEFMNNKHINPSEIFQPTCPIIKLEWTLELKKKKLINKLEKILKLDFQSLLKDHKRKVKSIHENFTKATDRFIDLSGIYYPNMPNVEIKWKKARKIYLKRCSIIDCPDFLYKLNRLRILDISDNKLINFPPFLTTHVNLVDLNLSQNYIRKLPNEISNLKNIVTLNLAENKISVINLNIYLLQNLNYLNLLNNPLRKIFSNACTDLKSCKDEIFLLIKDHYEKVQLNFESNGVKEYIGFLIFNNEKYLHIISNYLDTYSIFNFSHSCKLLYSSYMNNKIIDYSLRLDGLIKQIYGQDYKLNYYLGLSTSNEENMVEYDGQLLNQNKSLNDKYNPYSFNMNKFNIDNEIILNDLKFTNCDESLFNSYLMDYIKKLFYSKNDSSIDNNIFYLIDKINNIQEYIQHNTLSKQDCWINIQKIYLYSKISPYSIRKFMSNIVTTDSQPFYKYKESSMISSVVLDESTNERHLEFYAGSSDFILIWENLLVKEGVNFVYIDIELSEEYDGKEIYIIIEDQIFTLSNEIISKYHFNWRLKFYLKINNFKNLRFIFISILTHPFGYNEDYCNYEKINLSSFKFYKVKVYEQRIINFDSVWKENDFLYIDKLV